MFLWPGAGLIFQNRRNKFVVEHTVVRVTPWQHKIYTDLLFLSGECDLYQSTMNHKPTWLKINTKINNGGRLWAIFLTL